MLPAVIGFNCTDFETLAPQALVRFNSRKALNGSLATGSSNA